MPEIAQESSQNVTKTYGISSAKPMIMPVLPFASPHLLGGGCLITGFDQFQSATIISRQQHLQPQPVHNRFDNSAGQISSDQEATSDVHEVGTRQLPTKKRLSTEQVKLLENSFDLDSKLEPDRKNQLANDLGLQPRQVAVWYQNKRARSKTKQLEQKYVVLKEEFQVILAEKQQLETEVLRLRELLGLQEDKSPESTVVTPPAGKEDAGPVSSEKHEQASTVETRPPFLKEQEQPIKEADEKDDEDEGEPEETAVETEAESVELSCSGTVELSCSGTPCSGTGVSEALDSNSPPSNRCDLPENTSGLTQSLPSFVVQPSFSFDQVLLFNQQQHQMLHQLHHWTNFHQLGSVKLELDESAYLTKIPASEGDQLYSNYLLSLQDESASLDFEFVT